METDSKKNNKVRVKIEGKFDLEEQGKDFLKKVRKQFPKADLKLWMPLINHPNYYLIAKDSLEEAKKLPSHRQGKNKNNKICNGDDLSKLLEIKDNIPALISVIFSALTLESFINWYGSDALGKEYFDKYLDRAKVSSKWRIIPKLVTGKDIVDDGGAPIERLHKLITLRNDLVHYKASVQEVSKLTYAEWIEQEDAAEALAVVEEMIRAIRRIDPDLNDPLFKKRYVEMFPE
jgi:hypothetical protein